MFISVFDFCSEDLDQFSFSFGLVKNIYSCRDSIFYRSFDKNFADIYNALTQ